MSKRTELKRDLKQAVDRGAAPDSPEVARIVERAIKAREVSPPRRRPMTHATATAAASAAAAVAHAAREMTAREAFRTGLGGLRIAAIAAVYIARRGGLRVVRLFAKPAPAPGAG